MGPNPSPGKRDILEFLLTEEHGEGVSGLKQGNSKTTPVVARSSLVCADGQGEAALARSLSWLLLPS